MLPDRIVRHSAIQISLHELDKVVKLEISIVAQKRHFFVHALSQCTQRQKRAANNPPMSLPYAVPFRIQKCKSKMQNSKKGQIPCISHVIAEEGRILLSTVHSASLVLVSTVDVAAETVGARDDTILANGALSQGPAHGAAVITDTERLGADTDEGTILGAGSAVG